MGAEGRGKREGWGAAARAARCSAAHVFVLWVQRGRCARWGEGSACGRRLLSLDSRARADGCPSHTVAGPRPPSRPPAARVLPFPSPPRIDPMPRTTGAPRGAIARRARRPAASATVAAAVRVSITRRVPYGHAIGIVGAPPALGAWDPAAGVRLAWAEGDVWTAEFDVDG